MRVAITRFFLFISLCFFTHFAHAQIKGTNGLTVKVLGTDHATPLEGIIAERFGDYGFGRELGYQRWLSNSLALSIPFRFGVAKLPDSNSSVGEGSTFASLDLTGQLHPFITKWKVSPYLLAGIGGFFHQSTDIKPQVPLGLGFNIKLYNNVFLQLQSEYRLDFEDLRDNYMHSLGLQINFWDTPKPAIEEPIILPPADQDGDGVADAEDKCPDVPGLAAFGGCPDSDGDGIPDMEDLCPEVAGIATFGGCPDSDNDGITDAEDECPNQFGTAENKGCPVADADGDGIPDGQDACPGEAGPASTNGCPDTDGDGVINSADRCPNTAGTLANNGCPEIKQEVIETLNFVAQNVQFETGKAQLKAVSFGILDRVYDILQQYPTYNLAIGGHTDSIGGAETNQILSERRAKSCYDYLVKKGISPNRMNYVGYGETRPIADNRYKDGREQNRRVEFNLFLK